MKLSAEKLEARRQKTIENRLNRQKQDFAEHESRLAEYESFKKNLVFDIINLIERIQRISPLELAGVKLCWEPFGFSYRGEHLDINSSKTQLHTMVWTVENQEDVVKAAKERDQKREAILAKLTLEERQLIGL